MDYEYCIEVGRRCHWCGVRVSHHDAVRSGKHLFCCDAHKVALHRAYQRYRANCRVTAGSSIGERSADVAAPGGNSEAATRSKAARPRSAQVRIRKRNAKGRRK
jgi:hypothetical protein